MTDTPHTVDDLLDLWDDHAAPTESQMRHPSQYRPSIINVIGTGMQVVERTDGTFAVSNGHVWVSEGHPTGAEAYFVALDLHRRSRAEAPGARLVEVDDDPLGVFVGLGWAFGITATFAGAVWVLGRVRGAW